MEGSAGGDEEGGGYKIVPALNVGPTGKFMGSSPKGGFRMKHGET